MLSERAGSGRGLAARLAFAALTALASCQSPTLPLPPPGAPEELIVSDDATEVRLAGSGAIPGALVLVFNEEPTVLAGAIVTADANGRYRMTVPIDLTLSPANHLELWQRLGTQDSSLISFVVPANGTRGAPAADAGPEASPDGASPETETER